MGTTESKQTNPHVLRRRKVSPRGKALAVLVAKWKRNEIGEDELTSMCRQIGMLITARLQGLRMVRHPITGSRVPFQIADGMNRDACQEVWLHLIGAAPEEWQLRSDAALMEYDPEQGAVSTFIFKEVEAVAAVNRTRWHLQRSERIDFETVHACPAIRRALDTSGWEGGD